MKEPNRTLKLPEKLYGRNRELQLLLAALRSEASVTIVSGPSGIGKTSLVRAIETTLKERNGLLLEGKIDQYQRQGILGAITPCVKQFLNHLKQEPYEKSKIVKHDLKKRLRSQVGVIAQLIPETASLIGTVDVPSALHGEDSTQRTFQALIGLFEVMTLSHPIALFLDDLHWADETTFEFLNSLLTSPIPHLYLYLGYRPMEANSNRHLKNFLLMRDLQLNIPLTKLELKELDPNSIAEMLFDLLGESTKDLQEAASLIFNKTLGNIFYIKQFLQKLIHENVFQPVSRNPINAELGGQNNGNEHEEWIVNLRKIDSIEASTNVVNFVVSQFKQLDQELSDFLYFSSFLERPFQLQQLEALMSLLDVATAKIDSYAAQCIEQGILKSLGPKEIQFAHDRFQEAAYQLGTPEQREKIHFYCAKLSKDPSITAEHYLKSKLQSLGEIEKAAATKALLEAAIFAKDATFFEEAKRYVIHAKKYCQPNWWTTQPDWMKKLYMASGEILFRSGAIKEGIQDIEIALNQDLTPIDKTNSLLLLAELKYFNKEFKEATELTLSACRVLGLKLNLNPSLPKILFHVLKVRRKLMKFYSKETGFHKLLELPINGDPRSAQLENILAASSYMALGLGNLEFTIYNISLAVDLILEKGLSMTSAGALLMFPIILNQLGDYPIAKALRAAAMELAEIFLSKNSVLRVTATMSSLTSAAWVSTPWKDYVAQHRSLIEVSLDINFSYGFLLLTSYSYSSAPFQHLSSQDLLLTDLQTITRREKNAPRASVALASVLSFWNCFRDDKFPSHYEIIVAHLQKCRQIDPILATQHQNYITILAYLFTSKEEAFTSAQLALSGSKTLSGNAFQIDVELFYVLATLSHAIKNQRRLKPKEWLQIKRIQRKFKALHAFHPRNFAPYHFLIEAKWAIYSGAASWEVLSQLQKAIAGSLALENSFLSGLCLEESADFAKSIGDSNSQRFFIKRALQIYQAWGARAKVGQLLERFQDVLAAEKDNLLEIWKLDSARKLDELQDWGLVSSSFNDLWHTTQVGELIQKLTKWLQKLTLTQGIKIELSNIGNSTSSYEHTLVAPGYESSNLATMSCSEKLLPLGQWYLVEESGKRASFLIRSGYKGVGWLHMVGWRREFLTNRTLNWIVFACEEVTSIIEKLATNAEFQLKLDSELGQSFQNNQVVKNIFSHINQGVLTFGSDFEIHPQYSTYLEQLFEETHLEFSDVFELVFKTSNLSMSHLELARTKTGELFTSAVTNWEESLTHLPKQVQLNQKDLQLEWIPILNPDKKLSRMMLVVRDLTLVNQITRMNQEREAEIYRIHTILSFGVAEFKSYLTSLISHLDLISNSPTPVQLKAASSAFEEFTRKAQSLQADDLSQKCEQLQKLLSADPEMQLHSQIKDLTALVSTYSNTINLVSASNLDEIQPLVEYLVANPTVDALAKLDAYWQDQSMPICLLLKDQLKSLTDLSTLLSLSKPEVEISDESLPTSYQRLLQEVMVHLFRNSLDHGKASRIQVNLKGLLLTYSDNGAGLDLSAIRERQGIRGGSTPSISDLELANSIFQSGMTTAKKVTEISGRGIGLEAVKNALEKLGGSIQMRFKGEKLGNHQPFELVIQLPTASKLGFQSNAMNSAEPTAYSKAS